MPSLIQPGGAEFGFQAFAEIAFGLWVQVNASGDVHSFDGSLRLMVLGFG